MHELLDAVTDLAGNTPPDKITHLAEQAGKLNSCNEADRLSDWASTPTTRKRLDRLVRSWRDTGIPPYELKGILLGASHAYHAALTEQTVELVWTGPSSELVPTRKTEQALLQVIQAANAKLFLTSFVAYDVAPIMAALRDASERGVAISMLLESSDQHGGGISIDAIGKMRKAFPDAKVYFWRDKRDEFADGKVHAKVAVADEQLCFISSANLTGHAMEKNMEAGLLVKGGSIPEKLHRHLEALITTKQLSLD